MWRYPLKSEVNTCRAFPCTSQYKTRGYIRLRQRFVCSKRNYTDSLNFNPASEQRNDKKTESPHVDLQSAVQRKQSTVRRITKRSRLKENTCAFSPFLQPASVYLSKTDASILRWDTVGRIQPSYYLIFETQLRRRSSISIHKANEEQATGTKNGLPSAKLRTQVLRKQFPICCLMKHLLPTARRWVFLPCSKAASVHSSKRMQACTALTVATPRMHQPYTFNHVCISHTVLETQLRRRFSISVHQANKDKSKTNVSPPSDLQWAVHCKDVKS